MPGEFDMMADIEKDIGNVVSWNALTDDPDLASCGGTSYAGRGERWSFLVVRFPDAREWRYDGTATSASALGGFGGIERLLPSVAQRAFEAAHKGTSP